MTTTTSSLYINDNGMICCIDHAGSYLSSEYRHAPERDLYRTPLGSWERIDDTFVDEHVAIVGATPNCDMCR
jgi:hypothetical protein